VNGQVTANIRTPLRIVFLLQDLEFGGTQRYTLHVLKHLNRELFAPQLWVLCGKTQMAPLAREVGVDPVWMSRTPWVGPHSIAALGAQLIKRTPDILYTLTVVPNIWGRLFGAALRVPTIVSSWRGLYPKQYESWMWRLSNRIICNAGILKQIIVKRHAVPPHRIAVIRNGVNPQFYSPDQKLKSSAPLVLYVGRLVPDKDPLTLVEGFRRVSRNVPAARFEIIGDGHLKNRVEKFIRRHGLSSCISVLPGQLDTRPNLRRAWVLAMSSVREASPNVILEAMASELPVVAPRVGGIPELVQDRETGIIFEPGNPEALSRALTELLEDQSQRVAMGMQARKRVQEFHSVEGMVRSTERVLLEAARESELMRDTLRCP
jgi:glycosyltransferase involved in cell wall biosynthesis